MYKRFKDINISTTTIIVSTNLEIDLEWFHDTMECYHDIPSTTKNSKELQQYLVSRHTREGVLTMIQYKDQVKGFKVKKKKKKFFRNALSIVMFVGKLITIKIPTKGKLQMTGCTRKEHAQQCVRHLVELLSHYTPSPTTYTISGDTFRAYCHTVMTDIVFNLGFNINRQNLDRFVNKCTEFNSLLETSFGYTGVNIKVPFSIDTEKTKVVRIEYDYKNNKIWEISEITFRDYLTILSEKDVQKEIQKKRKNTFLVFHSGTAIMSGMSPEYMEEVYDQFITIIERAKDDIKETIL